MKAIEGGDKERARIYAETAIRNKNQALNLLRMSSRLEAIAQRIQSVNDMQKISKQMGSVVKGIWVCYPSLFFPSPFFSSFLFSCLDLWCVCLCVLFFPSQPLSLHL